MRVKLVFSIMWSQNYFSNHFINKSQLKKFISVYDEYSENAETTQSYGIKPVVEEEVVTKIYYTVGQTSTISMVQPFSCHFQDKWYREGESFRMGLNKCSVCMCVDTDIRCNDDECLEQTPEAVELEIEKEKNLTNLVRKQINYKNLFSKYFSISGHEGTTQSSRN